MRYMPTAEYLKAILSPLLSEPQSLSITQTQDELGVLLSVRLAQPDMGVVIGKEGSTAKAVRQLIKIHGMLNRARVNMKVLESDGSQFRREIIS